MTRARKAETPVIVHVNQAVIKYNTQHNQALPCLSIKHPTLGLLYAHAVEGFGRIVDCHHQGRKPLSCGARVWMEYDVDTFRVLGESTTWEVVRTGMGWEA